MRNITLTYAKPQISINGVVYDVRRSDSGILRDMMELDAEFADKDVEDPKTILEYYEAKKAYVDKVLGAGAMKSIWEGIEGAEKEDEPGIAFVNRLMSQILRLATAAYNEAISAKYDD